MADQYIPRVIVKFKDALVDLQQNHAAEQFLARLTSGNLEGTSWPHLVRESQFRGITIQKLLTAVNQKHLLELRGQAFHRHPSYRFYAPNLLAYFAVPCPPKVNPEAVAKVLSSWNPAVEYAYVASTPGDEPAVNPGRNPRWTLPDTGYLRSAFGGIDAEYAWNKPGGDGGKQSGINLQFFDIESDWDLTHPDLSPANPRFSGIGFRKADRKNHGTGVLGIVIASDSNPGEPYTQSSLGITPNVAVTQTASYWTDDYNTDYFNTIFFAIDQLRFGDVLLLELQINQNQNGLIHLPGEFDTDIFHVIQFGTALGIVIVEVAGNYNNDLDDLSVTWNKPWLRRNSPEFDSGAIMVSAASPWVAWPDTHHAPMPLNGGSRAHSYGSRVDCYAWGDNIYTTKVGGYGNFGDTSGASAIIAGVALSVQGMAEANLGYRLSPLQIRNILSDDSTGTHSKNGRLSDGLGVMPNLKRIAEETLGITPQIYIRDFVGDTGSPHLGPISMSPDIILVSAPVADPQADFGEVNAANRDNLSLSVAADPGKDHYIYVRVRNRGPAAALNVAATVYYSAPSTLVVPNNWTLIGQTAVADIPSGDILTVLPSLKWSTIPGTGHYCFVATIGCAQDPPPPTPADFRNWPNTDAWDLYCRFIRENNNVTWRNFDVVNNTPNRSGPIELEFFIRGTWSQEAAMRLELNSTLPPETLFSLQVPDKDWKVLAALGHLGPVEPTEVGGKKSFIIRLIPHGRLRTPAFEFPKMFEAGCTLLINLPKHFSKNSYEVSIRQLAQEQEVGRMTWRLQPEGEGS